MQLTILEAVVASPTNDRSHEFKTVPESYQPPFTATNSLLNKETFPQYNWRIFAFQFSLLTETTSAHQVVAGYIIRLEDCSINIFRWII